MKRFLSILLAMVMVLSLVACGDKKTPDTPDTRHSRHSRQAGGDHPHRYRDRFRFSV